MDGALNTFKFLLLFAAMQTCAVIFADNEMAVAKLSSLALLNRCYGHMTQTKLPLNHSFRAALNKGKDPVELCLSLLNNASFNSTGAQEGMLVTSNVETLSTLRTFNDFHRTWFPNDDLSASIPGCQEGYCTRESAMYDSGEAALHVTRALFTEGVKYSEVLTSNSSLEALRSTSNALNEMKLENSNATIKFLEQLPGVTVKEDGTGTKVLDIQLVQTGTLKGVRKLSLNAPKLNAFAYSDHSGAPVQVNQSFGGGAIGTQSYLLLNMGRNFYDISDGGVVMPRRWSKAILKDFLCRDLPVIRAGDAKNYVEEITTVDTPPFRKSQSCMQCHATMDPMAATARNFAYRPIPALGVLPTYDNVFVSFQPVASPMPPLAAESGQVDKDSNFSQRPLNGKFYFRNYKGDLIHELLTGISGLGQTITGTDDYYICAASRYFDFFTGIKVNLTDIGDPANTPLSLEDLNYRNKVIELGVNFHSHKSLKLLVKDILESALYQTSSMRDFSTITEVK